MALRSEILRKLRVAFSAEELQLLQADAEFAKSLSSCGETPEELRKLTALGGALLAERNRAKSRFRKRPEGE